MFTMNQKNTLNKLVKQALALHKTHTDLAYEKYNTEVLASAERHQPTTGSGAFDKEMRSIKARLSGRKAHAVKVARSLIIEHYLPQLSEAEDLNMSVREAIEAITITCGRCVSKNKLTGLFKRSGDTRYSPFFTDHKYKTSVLSHPVFVSLGSDIKALNEALPSTTNPKQKQLLQQLEAFK
jgi:hypothetical protein